MSVDKVFENCSSESLHPESSLHPSGVLAETLHKNGRVDVVSNHSSKLSSRVHNNNDSHSDQQTSVEMNTDRDNSRLLENGSPNMKSRPTLQSKSFDSYMESRNKRFLPLKTDSAPAIAGYIIKPSVVDHNEPDIEDLSAIELAERYSDSYVGSHKRGHPISHQSTLTCLLTGANSESLQSIESSMGLRHRGIHRIPLLKAASDEFVERHENISSEILGLQESFSSIPDSLQDEYGSKSNLLQKDEVVRRLECISSDSNKFGDTRSPVNSIEYTDEPSLGNSSHDSVLDEVELAEYSEPDMDSPIAGWKLDRRSSGQLFWRRDSSSLNGVDPRNRVKFRYDVEVCEFESRSSGAEDVYEDEDSLNSDEEECEKVNESFVQTSLQNREQSSSSTTVIYAFSIIFLVMTLLYVWLSYILDTKKKEK